MSYIITATLSIALAAATTWQVQNWRWEAQVDKIERRHAELMQQAEVDARAKEQDMQANVERIAHESENKTAQFVAQSAAANRAANGLRNEIARRNARPAPACPEAAAVAVEAGAARNILGECSERYRTVASEADRLSVQVSGLQDYAISVCQAK